MTVLIDHLIRERVCEKLNNDIIVPVIAGESP